MSPSFKLRHAFTAVALTTIFALPAAPADAALLPVQLPCLPGLTCTQPKPVCDNENLRPAEGNLGLIRSATLCLLNHERTKRDLSKLHANRTLRGVATRYAERMVDLKFFAHVSPSGGTFVQRIKQAAYLASARAYSIGENLAWGGGELSTPKRIVRAWMHSPEHKANILNGDFEDIGVGVGLGVPVAGGGSGATYVNEFGRRR
jgi:uncharacterized protein YkwD